MKIFPSGMGVYSDQKLKTPKKGQSKLGQTELYGNLIFTRKHWHQHGTLSKKELELSLIYFKDFLSDIFLQCFLGLCATNQKIRSFQRYKVSSHSIMEYLRYYILMKILFASFGSQELSHCTSTNEVLIRTQTKNQPKLPCYYNYSIKELPTF